MRKVPRRLYKYRADNANSVRLICDGELWFSSFESLNDPVDGVVSVHFKGHSNAAMLQRQVYKAAMEKWPDRSEQEWMDAAMATAWQRRSELAASIGDWAEKRLDEERKRPARVFCMSEESRSSVMWAHYSINHTGVCVEFDTGDPLLREARAVDYIDEPKPFSAAEIVSNSEIREAAPWLYGKATEWAYEKEWRVIRRGMPIGIQRIQRRSVTAVIFGCRMPKERRECYLDALRYRKIRMYQACFAKGSNNRILLEPVAKL